MQTFITNAFLLSQFGIHVDIGTAFLGLAALLDKYLLGVMTVSLVILGYMYMTSLDDPQRLMHVKRAIAAVVIGSIIVVVASTLAPELLTAFGR